LKREGGGGESRERVFSFYFRSIQCGGREGKSCVSEKGGEKKNGYLISPHCEGKRGEEEKQRQSLANEKGDSKGRQMTQDTSLLLVKVEKKKRGGKRGVLFFLTYIQNEEKERTLKRRMGNHAPLFHSLALLKKSLWRLPLWGGEEHTKKRK